MADLDRFLKAQEHTYERALSEIKNGRKETHWMWFIFPQIEGLGSSSMCMYYSIKDRKEAEDYIKHPLLWSRILEISSALLLAESSDPYEVMGYPDNRKLRSSMTLFYEVSGNGIFKKVLDKFYQGEEDEFTLKKLSEKGV